MRINANYLLSTIFAEDLLSAGITQAVISPGSRSTPLTLALTMHPRFRCFPVIDERSAGFFASGLARATDSPVVLVCTSGTAAAEYYPAVVEAYQQRIPLIVCTADRPEYLVDTGANQTIHQRGIFKNHIRHYFDAGLPATGSAYLNRFRRNLAAALNTAFKADRGPVHINFPFIKPFEPENLCDEISANTLKSTNSIINVKNNKQKPDHSAALTEVKKLLRKAKNPIIAAGPGPLAETDQHAIINFAESFNIPILADIGSGLRFGNLLSGCIISNYDSILRNSGINKIEKADLIFVFGMTMISAALDKYLSASKCHRIIINQFGDRYDPTFNKRFIINSAPSIFLGRLNAEISGYGPAANSSLKFWQEEDSKFESRKKINDEGVRRIYECRLVNEIINRLPDGSSLMLSNSLTYRVFDDFVSASSKNISVFHNRGASGIDGIISTAAGLALQNTKRTYLAIGDTAFYYDLNALWLLKKFSLPVTIFLFNNGGGRIFDILPVSKYKSVFEDYFAMPINVNFESIVKGFNGNYFKAETWKAFSRAANSAAQSETFTVIDIVIDAREAGQNRDNFRSLRTL